MSETVPTYDVLILGAGISGFAAALRLRKQGKKVAVLAGAPGATALSSGCWDFGPMEKASPLAERLQSSRWQELYRSLLIDDHQTPPDVSQVQEACTEVIQALEPWLPLSFSSEQPYCLPCTSGRFKLTFMAQEIQTGAHLPGLQNKKVALVSAGNWRFQPELIADQWTEAARQMGWRCKIQTVSWDWGKSGDDWPLTRVAALLRDEPELMVKLTEFVSKIAKEFDSLLFPPLFLNRDAVKKMKAAIPIPWAECVASTEPIPGERLHRAMEGCLAAEQIPYIRVKDRLMLPKTEGNRVEHMSYFSTEGWRQIRAGTYLLATGKYLGGGITLSPEGARETVFGLPLFTDRRLPVTLAEPGKFQRQKDWAKLGVWLDSRFRPLSQQGQPAIANVVACGSLVGGVDFARENMGMGFQTWMGIKSASVID